MALNPMDLYCESPVGACIKSTCHLFLLLIPLKYMVCWSVCKKSAACLASWTCYRVFSCYVHHSAPRPHPLNGILCCQVVTELEKYFWKYIASRIWWGLCNRHCAALLMMEATRCSNYSLILEGLLWHTQDHWTPIFKWLPVHLVQLAWCHHFIEPVWYSAGCPAGLYLFRLCGDRGHLS